MPANSDCANFRPANPGLPEPDFWLSRVLAWCLVKHAFAFRLLACFLSVTAATALIGIFEKWEADFGRTFVLSNDPDKVSVRDALPRVWRAGRDYFERHPDVTGAELFDYVVGVARVEGFEWGSRIAGHLVGEFPHKKIAGTATEWYIMPGSDEPMRRKDPSGRLCHWILEIHLVNRVRRFGGFYEQLLDLP